MKSLAVGARAALLWFINLALAAAGVSSLLFGVITLWRGGELAAVSTGFAAGLVFLLASSIERFESLKGLGIEARTRQLDKAITEANATLEQIRELAEISSETVVSLNSKVGRWDAAPTPREAYETVQRVRVNLKDLGCNNLAIKRVMAPWVQVTTRDQVRALLDEIRMPLNLVTEELNQAIQSYPQPVVGDDPAYLALIAKRNTCGVFEGNFQGGANAWPVGSHAPYLRSFVDAIPYIDEVSRQRLRSVIAPWLPRLEYLAENNDLTDKEAWFALRDPDPFKGH